MTLDELLEQMSTYVEASVKNNKKDFYFHDVKSLREDEHRDEVEYLWIIRENGTNMAYRYSEWGDTLIKYFYPEQVSGIRYFHITLKNSQWGIVEIETYAIVLELFKRSEKILEE